jgi:hypothetical protein
MSSSATSTIWMPRVVIVQRVAITLHPKTVVAGRGAVDEDPRCCFGFIFCSNFETPTPPNANPLPSSPTRSSYNYQIPVVSVS